MNNNKIQLEFNKYPELYISSINDTLNAIKGKWRLTIIYELLSQKSRFRDLQKNIDKITPRMLSKELKDLESKGIVKRTVHTDNLFKVEYELTISGEKLITVLNAMSSWGEAHRQTIINNQNNFCI